MALELKFLGQHKGSIVVLQEPLFVEAGIQVVDGFVDVVDAHLEAPSETLLPGYVGPQGPGYAAVEPEVHTLQGEILVIHQVVKGNSNYPTFLIQ